MEHFLSMTFAAFIGSLLSIFTAWWIATQSGTSLPAPTVQGGPLKRAPKSIALSAAVVFALTAAAVLWTVNIDIMNPIIGAIGILILLAVLVFVTRQFRVP